jgi:hypothetical protein
LVRRRDWACRAALPLFQPNSDHLVKAKEGKKMRCLPKRDQPQTQERRKGSERSERGAVSRLCHTTALLLFLFFLISIPRVRLFSSFILPLPSLTIQGEYTWASNMSLMGAHDMYVCTPESFISSALIARPSLIPAHPAAPSSVGRSKVLQVLLSTQTNLHFEKTTVSGCQSRKFRD